MSRRNAAVKRPILPDPQFNNRLATMMVARLMKHGKKSTAQRILSDAFGLIGERTGGDPVELFETAVKNAKAGQVRFRTDKAGIIHSTIGKADFESDALKANLEALLASLVKLKPASSKGQYLKKVAVSTTMGPGLVIDHTTLEL